MNFKHLQKNYTYFDLPAGAQLSNLFISRVYDLSIILICI
jgi:hypothetical protein